MIGGEIMRNLLSIMVFMLLMLTYYGCGGKNYSMILSPDNLRKHASEPIEKYSTQMGNVKVLSKGKFEVDGVCKTGNPSGCPVDKYITKFYSYYCSTKGGTFKSFYKENSESSGLKPPLNDFINSIISSVNRGAKQEINARYSTVPSILKNYCNEKVTVGDIKEWLLGFYDSDYYKLYYCSLPSDKKLYLFALKDSCYRQYNSFVCPYEITVAKTSLPYLIQDLKIKLVNKMAKCIDKQLKVAKSKYMLGSAFEPIPGLLIKVFAFKEENPYTRDDIFYYIFIDNRSGKTVDIPINRLAVAKSVCDLNKGKCKYINVFPLVRIFNPKIAGSCKISNKTPLVVSVNNRGKCIVSLGGETIDVEDEICPKCFDTKLYLVFNNDFLSNLKFLKVYTFLQEFDDIIPNKGPNSWGCFFCEAF